jgi:hypothetical protein
LLERSRSFQQDPSVILNELKPILNELKPILIEPKLIHNEPKLIQRDPEQMFDNPESVLKAPETIVEDSETKFDPETKVDDSANFGVGKKVVRVVKRPRNGASNQVNQNKIRKPGDYSD